MDAKRYAADGGALVPAVGLCSVCRHATTQQSAKGRRFWRCRLADSEPAFRRYPPLPVERCDGFRAGRGPGRDDPG